MAEYKGKLLKGLFKQAKDILMSDGTDAETAINARNEWTLAGDVTSTTAVLIAIPNTAKEVLALLTLPSNSAIYTSLTVPFALMSNAISLKNPSDTSKELYYNGTRWRVTDSAYAGKIYYR